jgi:hypothetical protein
MSSYNEMAGAVGTSLCQTVVPCPAIIWGQGCSGPSEQTCRNPHRTGATRRARGHRQGARSGLLENGCPRAGPSVRPVPERASWQMQCRGGGRAQRIRWVREASTMLARTHHDSHNDDWPKDRSAIRAAYLSTYPPRECGIATFCEDLVTSTLLDERAGRPLVAAMEPASSAFSTSSGSSAAFGAQGSSASWTGLRSRL